MGIAVEFADTAACGITSVGAAEVVEFEFDVADIEMFAFGEAEIEEFKFVELEIDVLEFVELGTEELAIIDPLEIKVDTLSRNVFNFNISAERTSLAAFAADAAVVAGVAGLNSTKFWPTEVVLNCRD